MKLTLLGLVPLAALAGCAATTTNRVATADQRAYCERMSQTMGTKAGHDHGETKGMGPNAMNLSHARCRDILAAKQ
jgi:hypothetical protein